MPSVSPCRGCSVGASNRNRKRRLCERGVVMDFLFFNQAPKLDTWETRPWSPGVEEGPGITDRRDSYERTVARETPGDPEPGGPFRRVADAILAYRIFPPALATGVLRRHPVQVGDTVGLQYHRFRIVDVFFASR